MTQDQTESLVSYLTSRRWFGDKTRTIRGARLRDRIVVSWPNADRDFAVARADVETDAGTSTYQLLLDPERGPVADALEDEQFRRGLVDAFARGATFDNGDVRWIIESRSRRPLVAPPDTKITLSSAEQSNSSVIVEGEAILKLFRRLEPGVHPDVEVTSFLTIERQFLHVPVLLGTIRFEDTQGSTVAGMLQELVPGAMDGWSYALKSTKEFFKARAGADLPFQGEARELGSVTRQLHETLASGAPGSDFERVVADSSDLDQWTESTLSMIRRSIASLRSALEKKTLPGATTADASTIADAGERFAGLVQQWRSTLTSDAGAKARTHGDYHLGQVLRSSAGRFLVIDFEGEPARPLRERRTLQSPLRDVAGMLRSFAYLGAVAAGGVKADADRVSHWERSTREAFLEGYFAHDASGELLPRDRSHAQRLIALFEAEKVFYELQYELDHRPDWVWIPLRGITTLTA